MTGSPYRIGRVSKEVTESGLAKARAALDAARSNAPKPRELPEVETPGVQCAHPAWNRRDQVRVCASCGTVEAIEVEDPASPLGEL